MAGTTGLEPAASAVTECAIYGISSTYENSQVLKVAVRSGWEHFVFPNCSRKKSPKQEYNYADGLATSVHSRFSQAAGESTSRLQGRSSWLDLRPRRDRPGSYRHPGFSLAWVPRPGEAEAVLSEIAW